MLSILTPLLSPPQQRSLLLQQQAKSVRSNKCILFSLLEKGLKKEDFHLQRVVCMDVAGKFLIKCIHN